MTLYTIATRGADGCFVLDIKSNGLPGMHNHINIIPEVKQLCERIGTRNVMVLKQVDIETNIDVCIPSEQNNKKE